MRTIFFLLSLLALSVSCQSSKPRELSPEDLLNKVNKNYSENGYMMATETGSKCNHYWTVASKKGLNKKGEPCLLIKQGTNWMPLESDIKHFQYKEGYEYEIVCDHESFDDKSKADEYTLVAVRSKSKKDSDTRKEQEKGTFEESTWNFTHFEGVEVNDGYLQFSAKRLDASAGCNAMSSMQFKANEQHKTIEISIENSMMTSKACNDRGMMERESRMWDLFKAVSSYTATANELVLLDKNGKELLKCKR